MGRGYEEGEGWEEWEEWVGGAEGGSLSVRSRVSQYPNLPIPPLALQVTYD